MLARLTVILFAVLAAAAVLAKGVTARIVISGEELEEPVVITEPGILERFSIWSGPNSRFRVQGGEWQTDYSRIFTHFQAGIVEELPPDLMEFDVEFHQADRPDGKPWEETYSVRYAMTPGTPNGYIYLPVGNPFIHHGVEGNWLNSTAEWEESVRPLIEQSLINAE